MPYDRDVSRNTASALLALSLLGMACTGCTPDELTQVLVRVDAQPGLRASAATLELRVFDHERNVVLDESRPLVGDAGNSVELPAVVPLVPREGDAQRSFVVEATLIDDVGGILARGRAVGRYVAGEVREALLCLEDVCRGELCGDTATDCSIGATTCRPLPPVVFTKLRRPNSTSRRRISKAASTTRM